jgi:hypothetical protein
MPAYSPERRTAVVLSGTGVHGAYHAGVLRALQESGVKVDLLAGHGAGAANAALAAIDGQARLWEADGLWLGPQARTFYSWTPPVRVLVWLLVAVAALILAPLALVVASGLIVYPLSFVLDTFGGNIGDPIVTAYQGWLQRAFSAAALPTVVPRLGMTLVVGVGLLLGGVAARAAWQDRGRRTAGAPWWRVVGSPMDAEVVRQAMASLVGQLLRGTAPPASTTAGSLGRRYSEVLSEGLGQPGFRELIVAATDLDGQRDVIGVLLREPYAHEFMAARSERDRRADVLDFTGAGRDQVIDLVGAALTPPVAAEPHAVRFAADGHWRGETHRLCDRPGIVHRLLEEVAAAGVTQAIVVSACAPVSDPHHLPVSRLDVRHRTGEFIAAAEAGALRDALETARLRFDAVYVIRPSHNALGPFDCAGVYDRASDRQVEVAELAQRGYDDALQQFIGPVVGASGDRLAQDASPDVADDGEFRLRPAL